MNCETGERRLAAYLDGTLAVEDRAAFERHMASCPDCKDAAQLWSQLGALPEPEPSARMRRRFEEALAVETGPRPWMLPIPRFVPWAVAACMLLAAGWAMGRFAHPPAPEVADLKLEVRQLKTLVALSLLNQQSASERLKGIGYAGALREDSRDVLDALISALKYDSNVNVRLAACDALRSHAADARVRRAFVEALGEEESPLAKVSLIDALVDLREKESVNVLTRLSSLPDEDAAVKERASRALEQMKTKGAVWKE